MKTPFAAPLIAAAVIATFVASAALSPLLRPSREQRLIGAFPQLSRHADEPAPMGPSSDIPSIAQLVPDPFIRSVSTTPEDHAYDNTLAALLNAQKDLRREEERSFDRATGADPGTTQATLDDARKRRDEAENAAEAAGAARDARAGARAGIPGYHGVLVQRNTALVRFRDDATVEAIRDFLTRQQLVVRGGIASIGLFVVEVNGAKPERTLDGDATRLRAVIDLLKEERALVDTAVQNSLLGPNVVPGTALQKTAPEARDWFATAPPRDALVLTQFPEAWNFNQAIAAHNGHVNVAVLDIGFNDVCQQPPCDLPITFVCPLTSAPHGTAVASIIGATFGDRVGMDGACPFAALFGCTPDPPPKCDPKVSDCSNLTVQGKLFSGYLQAFPTLLQNSGARVVNASIGYNWGHFQDVDPNGAALQDLVAGQGATVRSLLRIYSDTILVASAGNDSSRPGLIRQAVWASPFNWASLYGAVADQSPNVVVVESLHHDLGTDQLTPRIDSNDGGAIAAIGDYVLSISRQGYYGYFQGTSAATPLVTATIAMMLANNSTLTVDQIKSALDLGPGKQLNAFKALCASASDCKIKLADLSLDGTVDRTDFDMFKDGFQQVRKNQFKDDLNKDGDINNYDSMFCRIDLNGDGKVDETDLEVMIDAWYRKLSQQEADALRYDLVH